MDIEENQLIQKRKTIGTRAFNKMPIQGWDEESEKPEVYISDHKEFFDIASATDNNNIDDEDDAMMYDTHNKFEVSLKPRFKNQHITPRRSIVK